MRVLHLWVVLEEVVLVAMLELVRFLLLELQTQVEAVVEAVKLAAQAS
jgi:hypothetical protein